MAMESIAKTLGTGSGIDIKALVDNLVEALFETKNKILKQKSDTLDVQISKLGELKSSITGFSSALAGLASGGTLMTQPTSSNTALLKIAALPGARLAGTNAIMEVRQLAQSQVASTDIYTGGSASAVPTGTLTLTFGTATVDNGAMTDFTAGPAAPIDITIDPAHATLAGVASAINAKQAGVTASILTDSGGARLVIKGATGASQAFTLSGIAGLEVGKDVTGSSINTVAQDAIVSLDGVQATRTTNTISNLIPGTRIDLVSAAPGTKVTIGTQAPTAAISQTITNFVDTFNEVYKQIKEATDPVDGPLRRDPVAKDLLRQLRTLTTQPLLTGVAAGAPATLADIGVGTQRDGTLSVNAARVATVLNDYPGELEAMFASGAGLIKAFSDISARATDAKVGLGVSLKNYTDAKDDVAEDQEKAAAAAETMRTRMTRQFAGMDAIVSAYKSTQSFLEQQVDAWNRN